MSSSTDANAISRRRFLAMLGGAAASFAVPDLAFGLKTERPPNFVVIMADDLSARELACYGNKDHKTPNLDKLARTGVMFNTCWATPLCSPTRAMIMTGRYAHRTGYYDMVGSAYVKEPLVPKNTIFSQALKKAGYATAIAGKWQLMGTQKEHGFDESCMWEATEAFDGPRETKKGGGMEGRAARYWHPAIVKNGEQLKTTESDYGPDIFRDFLVDFIRRHKDGPFLAYWPECLVHKTFDFDNKRSGYVAPPQLDAQGKKTGKKGETTLKASVEYLDHLIGGLVQSLEDMGIRDRTVIIFAGDNGTAGEGKGTVEAERGVRVPLIVNCPGLVKPLGATSELVSLADVMPTMLEMAGTKLPSGYEIDGVSFAPLLTGGAFKGRDHLFSYLRDKQMARDRRYILDGHGDLYDCGDSSDETGCRKVTGSTDTKAVEARKRLEAVLAKYPKPDRPEQTRARNPNKRARNQREKALRARK